MTKPRRPSNTEHPVALGSFRSWMKLLRNGTRIDPAYLPRAVFVSLTTLLTGPLRLWEGVQHGRRTRRTEVHPEPVFIIGHWRSGTTHLLNLLSQDPNLTYLSTFQAMAPGFCLVGDGAIKRLLAKVAAARYPTRLIDSIHLALDAPQEDEFALANLTPLSFIHAFSFPRQAHEIFERSVLFADLSDADRARWIEQYLALLRKATLAGKGRRLVIKNCAHTARIPTLLRLFPDARFVHIHRDPYEVFLSTLHMHRTVLPRSQLQEVESERLEANVLRFYQRLMRRFLEDRSLIPDGRLIEMRFEDLEEEPLGELRRMYGTLDLPDFDRAEPRIRQYLDSVAGYRKNAYELDDAVIGKVNEHWAFAFDEWGYDRRAKAQSVRSDSSRRSLSASTFA